MSKTFFTADTHFGHKNILKHQKNRGMIFSSIEQHDEELIKRWNSVVAKDDIVYHMGDVSLCSINNTISILKRLNGRINLILGNHDDLKKIKALQAANLFDKVFEFGTEIYVKNQKIILCHYAMKVWNKSHRGSWHLYGHSHGSLPDDHNSLSFDVGVDCHQLTPIEFENVKEIMNKKNFKPIDHHE